MRNLIVFGMLAAALALPVSASAAPPLDVAAIEEIYNDSVRVCPLVAEKSDGGEYLKQYAEARRLSPEQERILVNLCITYIQGLIGGNEEALIAMRGK